MVFTTFDHDQDNPNPNCTELHETRKVAEHCNDARLCPKRNCCSNNMKGVKYFYFTQSETQYSVELRMILTIFQDGCTGSVMANCIFWISSDKVFQLDLVWGWFWTSEIWEVFFTFMLSNFLVRMLQHLKNKIHLKK